MSRFLLCAVMVAPSMGLAQCVMQADLTNYNAMCGSYMVDYAITNGTPPYSITVMNFNGQLLQETTLNAQGSWVFEGTSWNVTMSVTDGAGCTAQTVEASPVFHAHQSSTFTWSTACVTGLTSLRMECSMPICDPANLPYTLEVQVNGNYQPYASGSFADDWTWAFNGYELNGGLPPGRYRLIVPEAELSCQDGTGNWIECWNIWPATNGGAESFFLGINAGDCGANAYVRAALGGAYANGLMRDDLRTSGLLPLVEPYSGLGYTFIGPGAGASVQPAQLAVSGDLAIVDWVVLEVRQSSSPQTVVRSKPALLLRNGSIHDSDGDPYVNFGVLPAGSYRLALRHRNHLGVMTSGPVVLAQSPGPVTDFRFVGAAFGGSQATTFSGATRLLWPGDATGNGQVKYAGGANDRDAVLQAVGGGTPTNTVNNVYDRRDVNLDGSIKYTGSNNDRDVILQTIGGTVPTAVRTQQLP